MKKILNFLKKELMLTLAVLAAVISLFITPPDRELISKIDWHTLGMLLMMLCVLEGFKKENVLRPVVGLASKLKTMTALSLFLIFGVFFTSMFVTNDVSLIIFVPLTILLFRGGGKSISYLLYQWKISRLSEARSLHPSEVRKTSSSTEERMLASGGLCSICYRLI